MAECFVIQPFDDGKFDRRYEETFAPAIVNAGLEPYRVDKDQSLSDLVHGIKEGIERSTVVLADITLDNPNVWYELGHAIAKSKPFCIICSNERTTKYPFDISMLKIIPYETGSAGDYVALGNRITERIKAVSTQAAQLRALSQETGTSPSDLVLQPFERAALLLTFEEHLSESLSIWTFTQQMEKAGFTKAASTLGLLNLKRKGFVDVTEVTGEYNNTYKAVVMTESGVTWVQDHPDELAIQIVYGADREEGITDDDIPF